MAIVSGTSAGETLNGTSGQDTIYGFAGNDILYGRQDDDTLHGGADDDQLYGGAGNDLLDGGAGADTMRGDIGDDIYLVDNIGDHVIEGSSAGGTDLVQSSISFHLGAYLENLTLLGTGAINGIGNGLANTLIGNSGANVLDGLAGADVMKGAGGDDTYVVDNIGDQVIEGSATGGTDLVDSWVSFTLGANLENLTLLGTGDIDGLGNGIGNIITGNSGLNELFGNDGADVLYGRQGDDSLHGGIGADQLNGGDGNDSLEGGAGADTMRGGPGDDVYVVDNAADAVVEVNPSEGTDLVDSTVSFTLGAYVENLTLLGSSEIDATGNSLDNVITGNEAVNVLTGGAGNDTLDGGLDADTVYGGIGNDTLITSGDYVGDWLYGGSGDDLYEIIFPSTHLNSVVTEYAGEGHDTVSMSFDAAGVYTLPDNVEDGIVATWMDGAQMRGNAGDNVITDDTQRTALYGGDGNDTLKFGAYLNGENGNDICIAGDSDSSILGGTGDDTLTGGAGNDVIYGETGNDTLSGGDGTDTLIGGDGNDVMTGGAGADYYGYQNANEYGGVDEIFGFQSTFGRASSPDDDTLSFSQIDATQGTGGGNDAFNYIGSNAFSGTPGELRVVVEASSEKGSIYHFYGDTNGDAVPDLEMIVHVIGPTLYMDDVML